MRGQMPSQIRASVVVPIDKLSIVVTVAFSYFVFKENLTRKSGAGLALIVAGTLLMTLPGDVGRSIPVRSPTLEKLLGLAAERLRKRHDRDELRLIHVFASLLVLLDGANGHAGNAPRARLG